MFRNIPLKELLEVVKRENLPKVELVKGEELVEDKEIEDTGVFRATNKLLSNMLSDERTKYLTEYETLQSIIKKSKRNESYTENIDTYSYTRDGETCTIKKPIYRNIHELIERLSYELGEIEYKLKEKRNAVLMLKNKDPKLNKELQELDKLHGVYTLSLKVYHQYYEKLNSINDKHARIKELKAMKNNNRLEQRLVFSQIQDSLNSRRINYDALNQKIRNYLKLSNTYKYPTDGEEESKDTESIEEKIRLLNEELDNNLESAVIIVQSEISKKTDSEKPKKVKIMKKKPKGKKKKASSNKKGGKSKEALLSDVMDKLDISAETEVEAGVEPETEDFNLLLSDQIEEPSIEERIEDQIAPASVSEDDINLQKSIENALHISDQESDQESEYQMGGDPEIKTIVIKQNYKGSSDEGSSDEGSSDEGSSDEGSSDEGSSDEVEELELSDDINELISDNEFENYSFEDSYKSGSDEDGDSNIPLNLN